MSTRARPSLPIAGALLASALAAAACSRERASTPAAAAWRPDVLLVTLDTTRADALGCYGATHGLTPALDGVAARGVRFADARAPTPVTLPSHATILTGTYPFQHGVRDNGTFVLGDGAITLAERLRDAGWATAAIPAAFVVDSAFGLGQGFERYDDVSRATLAVGGEGEERPADAVVERALALLAARDPDRPLFLWVHFFDPHFPYAPPADLQQSHPLAHDPAQRGHARARQRWLYELELAHVDRELARLLAAVEASPRGAETLVVVVGDHGEGLGDHGESSHATFVYDSTLRIPLLLAHPRLPRGEVVDAAVSSIDVAPTLLELLGLPLDGTHGEPLAAAWEGREFAPRRALYFENCSTWFSSGWTPLWGVVEGRFKTIVGRETRVFDVVADPDERRDVAADHPDVVERARALLADYAEMTLAAARHAPDAGELAELARLGYVQSRASTGREGRVPPGFVPDDALTPEEGLANQRRFTEANQLWQQGRRDEAIARLLELTAEEPGNAHYAEIAAALLHELRRSAEALPLAQRAVELADSVGGRITLAACLLALERRDEAIALLEETVERFPTVAAARINCARALLDAGRGARAREILAPLDAGLPADAPLRATVRALLARAAASG